MIIKWEKLQKEMLWGLALYIYIYIYIYRNTHQTLYFPISRYKVEQCPNSIYFSKYAIFQKLLMIK